MVKIFLKPETKPRSSSDISLFFCHYGDRNVRVDGKKCTAGLATGINWNTGIVFLFGQAPGNE
jgi:hypothetical protein